MGTKRGRLTDSLWPCEMCDDADAERSPRRPGPLGPTSHCNPCATLSLRAAKIARRCPKMLHPPAAAPPAPPRPPRRVSGRTQERFQQRWCMVTSVVEDAAVEALMRRHTWQPASDRGQHGQPEAQDDADMAWVATKGWVAPIVVRSAGVKGNGAYAARFLRALEPIGEYSGVVVGTSSSMLRQHSGSAVSRGYTFELRCCGLVVDAASNGNLTRFINHAVAPNVFATIVIVGGLRKIALRALCMIEADEELLLDYGYEREGWLT